MPPHLPPHLPPAGNLFVTDAFLGGEFFNFGEGAVKYLFGDVTDISNPLNQVFPKVVNQGLRSAGLRRSSAGHLLGLPMRLMFQAYLLGIVIRPINQAYISGLRKHARTPPMQITKCTWNKFGPTGSIQSFDSLCVMPLNIANEKTYVMLWLVYIITTVIVVIVVLWHFALIVSRKLRNFYIMVRLRRESTKTLYKEIENKLNYGDWFIIKHLSSKMLTKYFDQWLALFCEELAK
ncbi:Innexin [Trinorchestia longiramus]|nr:Innexin [Trinorchestia longiramus]